MTLEKYMNAVCGGFGAVSGEVDGVSFDLAFDLDASSLGLREIEPDIASNDLGALRCRLFGSAAAASTLAARAAACA